VGYLFRIFLGKVRGFVRVLIAGGGTGGHVIPALAIARELRDKHGAEVRFVGTARGLETKLVPEAGFALELIVVGQLKGVSLATRLRTLCDLPLGLLRCVGLLRGFKPDVVMGVGGYASGPLLYAASLRGIPTLIQEQNSYAGITNKWLSKKAKKICVAFDGMEKFFPFNKIIKTGNPIRKDSVNIAGKHIAKLREMVI